MSAILEVGPLGFPWATSDPFLFCVHHVDGYPAGNDAMGPKASLQGRRIGMDFHGVETGEGWRMYHGDVVPGFPQHPHRGFETITVVRSGVVDHSDSLGATARIGAGDVQWMTAGKGIVHAEMFPLVRRDDDNPLELFQIWLNLPAENKMVDPYFSMYWREDIPKLDHVDEAGHKTEVTVVAGQLGGLKGPKPPPDSWASRPNSDVALMLIDLHPGASWKMPAAKKGTKRTLFVYAGQVDVDDKQAIERRAVYVRPEMELKLKAGAAGGKVLLMQGAPIGEPVVQHGPFVMNTRQEIEQAFMDYRSTRFGGWRWGKDDPVHPRDKARFALHPDGREDRPKV